MKIKTRSMDSDGNGDMSKASVQALFEMLVMTDMFV